MRATSALLSVMRGVPEFGSAILRLAGGPQGNRRVETYSEVRLTSQEGADLRPDGAAVVRVPRLGRRSWLIEVKTGASMLKPEQLDAYLDLAKGGGFDALLTISNQITSSPTESPVVVPSRRGRPRPPHFHLSWWRILAEAVVQHQHRGVSDPDQAWILEQLIEYLDDERSGVIPFRDMGPSWTHVRDAARLNQLNSGDSGAQEVAERWEQLIEYLCLSLFRDLGRTVTVPVHKEAAEVRRQQGVDRLVTEGKLTATIKIRDAAAPVEVEADLRARMVYAGVELGAPQDKPRPGSRCTWLLRQLKSVPEGSNVHIEALYTRGHRSGASLDRVREDSGVLLHATDPSRPPRAFRISLGVEMSRQRGRRAQDGGFIESTRQHVADFYRQVVQGLVPWRPAAPKLPAGATLTPAEPDAIAITDLGDSAAPS